MEKSAMLAALRKKKAPIEVSNYALKTSDGGENVKD